VLLWNPKIKKLQPLRDDRLRMNGVIDKEGIPISGKPEMGDE
jgi:hypothetical protein